MSKSLPTPETLNMLLRYKPESGRLFWRARMPELFSSGGHGAESNCRIWNARFAGESADIGMRAGYRTTRVFSVRMYSHRIVWAMETGEWPQYEIDHKDHDRRNNRIENLRSVTRAENARNISLNSSNTSGISGVTWHKSTEKWQVRIGSTTSKQSYVGIFSTFEDAVMARKEAEDNHGYHKNHGSGK